MCVFVGVCVWGGGGGGRVSGEGGYVSIKGPD